MREMIFRGKVINHPQKQLNGRWATGYLSTLTHVTGVEYFIEDFSDWGLNMKWEVDPKTIGAYIGKNDINKIKIYEKDIVEIYDWGVIKKNNLVETAEVVWDQEMGQWSIGYSIEDRYDLFNKATFKIIGNTIDNPDLLKYEK